MLSFKSASAFLLFCFSMNAVAVQLKLVVLPVDYIKTGSETMTISSDSTISLFPEKMDSTKEKLNPKNDFIVKNKNENSQKKDSVRTTSIRSVLNLPGTVYYSEDKDSDCSIAFMPTENTDSLNQFKLTKGLVFESSNTAEQKYIDTQIENGVRVFYSRAFNVKRDNQIVGKALLSCTMSYEKKDQEKDKIEASVNKKYKLALQKLGFDYKATEQTLLGKAESYLRGENPEPKTFRSGKAK